MLTLFPEGALAHSVITCVWIGVLIVVTLNLRFGWVLSGLVVPGYLAPLIFVKPIAAAVIGFEALVTYGLVRLLAAGGSRLRLWPYLFGRDRFFALLLLSVVCRLLFDGWLFPLLSSTLEQRYHWQIDLRTHLHSFGLIIICLLANQFWKTGLRAGLIPVLVPIVLTCLVLRFGLMELTNFSIGNLNFIYEDVAASLVASPKSYVILLLAAWLASRMNLRYGWDFNGILIPSLLALQWYQPEKILMSFVEALLIVGCAELLLRSPLLRQSSMEGGRKLLLFFSLSFAYKFAIGWWVLLNDLPLTATDLFGFGYLLPTLLALKMHDKQIVARLTRATAQLSLLAVLGGSAAAYGLTLGSRWLSPPFTPPLPVPGAELKRPALQLTTAFAAWETTAFEHQHLDSLVRPLATELDQFDRALRALQLALVEERQRATAAIIDDPPALLDLSTIGDLLRPVGYTLIETDTLVLLREEPNEQGQQRGWGSFLLRRGPSTGPLVSVPVPLEANGLIEAGWRLMQLLNGHAMGVCGNAVMLSENRNPQCLVDRGTMFHAFHRAFRQWGVLEVRGRQEPDSRRAPVLRVAGAINEAVQSSALEQLFGAIDLRFVRNKTLNVQAQLARGRFAQLELSGASLRALLYAQPATQSAPEQRVELAAGASAEHPISSVLPPLAVLLGKPERWHATASEGPGIGSQLHLEERVLRPLLRWIERFHDTPHSGAAEQELTQLKSSAAVHGYRLTFGTHTATRNEPLTATQADIPTATQTDIQTYVVLLPTAESASSHGVGLALNLQPRVQELVAVPAASAEPGTLPLALRYLGAAGSIGLLWRTGTEPQTAAAEQRYLLVAQALFRAAQAEPLIVLEVRGANHTTTDAAIISLRRSNQELQNSLPPHQTSALARINLPTVVYDASPATAGYGNAFAPLTRYLRQTRNKLHATLWVPQRFRRGALLQPRQHRVWNQLRLLGLRTRSTARTAEVSVTQRAARLAAAALPPALHPLQQEYLTTLDISVLETLLEQLGSPAYLWPLEPGAGLVVEAVNGTAYQLMVSDPAQDFGGELELGYSLISNAGRQP